MANHCFMQRLAIDFKQTGLNEKDFIDIVGVDFYQYNVGSKQRTQ